MFSIQMIILVMAVLTYADNPLPYHAHLPAGAMCAIVILSHALIVAFVWLRARKATWALHTPGANPNAVTQSVDRTVDRARWLTVVLTPLLLWGLGWGGLVIGTQNPGPGIDAGWELQRFFFVPQLIFLAPGIVSWLFFWASAYQVENATRQRTIAVRLERRIPVHDMPSAGAYVWMQFRHNCIILVPITLAAMLEELFKQYVDRYSLLVGLVTAVAIVKMVVFFPWLMTRLWDTTPLTGALRHRLDAIAAEHKLRFRNILLWKSHHMVSNAAILGFFPFVRYFLLSDALLERLTDRQIEAVFAHEVGHGKHRHFWWFAATLAAILMIAAGVSTLALLMGTHFHWLPEAWDKENISGGMQLIVSAGILFFVFLPISRQFEHQADWFATRHMARHVAGPKGPEEGVVMSLDQFVNLELGATYNPAVTGERALAGHPAAPLYISTGTRPMGNDARMIHGAEVFIGALFELVDLSHRSRDSGGHLHPSPNRRANLLYAMATNPYLARQFEKRMLTLRLFIVLLVALGITGVILERAYPV